MTPSFFLRRISLVSVVGLYLGVPGCSQEPQKMTISTSSTEALDLYVKGRDLREKLRVLDARNYFEQAMAKDPDFALGHLALADTWLSSGARFEALQRAVSRIESVSEGERYMILAREAAFKRDPVKQKEYLVRLVEAYPDDERGHQLLGSYYFQNQDYTSSLEPLERAIKINPDFSPPYNLLGYSYRHLGRFAEAEEAFKKYLTLIPGEPNPYDSYAELLMKMGRFDESIKMYRLALDQDPTFLESYIGIGNNQIFKGEEEEARKTFGTFLELAPTTGQKRWAYFWIAISHIYEGDMALGVEVMEKAHALAIQEGDFMTRSEDLVRMGHILLESGELDDALENLAEALDLVNESETIPEEIKGQRRRDHFYYQARIAMAKGDLKTARITIDAYSQLVEVYKVPDEIRRRHELEGILAMSEKDFETAVREFRLADQENPQVLFLLAQAYDGWGDVDNSQRTLQTVANFNSLNPNFAFVRDKAKQALAEIP